MATRSCWHPWLDSPAWVRVFCITIWSWPWAHKIHILFIAPVAQKPEKILRIPSSWKPESKITNVSRGQHMFPVRSTLYVGSAVRQASSYLFLRMKLLLENLKLCCGTHDMLVPILLGSGGGLHHSDKTQNALPTMNEVIQSVWCAPCRSQTSTEGEVGRASAWYWDLWTVFA